MRALELTGEAKTFYSFCMDGTIRTQQCCPKCKGKFTGQPLTCPSCLTIPTRYYIDLYRKGHPRLKIYTDKLGRPIRSWSDANIVISSVRYEITENPKNFNQANYRAKNLKKFKFETRIKAWLEDKYKVVDRGHMTRTYVDSVRRYSERFYIPFFRDTDIREIRGHHIREFLGQLPSHLKPVSQNRIMSILKSFFHLLYEEYDDIIVGVPKFPKIKLDDVSVKWTDQDTQDTLLEKIPERHKPIIHFLFRQGTRISEAIALKVKDVEFSRDKDTNELEAVITISRTFSGSDVHEKTKGRSVKPRYVNPELVPMLFELCGDKHPEAWVFINQSTGSRYNQGRLISDI